ncbi:MAG: polysaccharide deacetylase family protein [Flavisolibacter sp.]
MHRYFIKIPWFVKKLFSYYRWNIPNKERAVYFTFDDGPHPTITPWVLDILASQQALATFFCIGKNVEKYPEIYKRILAEGHAVGNHTHNHLNGWKTKNDAYLMDVEKASKFIQSGLFRPPYGRIKPAQAKQVRRILPQPSAIIMWDVLSSDFDTSLSGEKCLELIMHHAGAGSIIVFHDSEKAFPNLQYALPRCLENLKNKGFYFRKINA